jgi:hypothetical protein
MKATTSASELQEAVEAINADVKVFERRADRLASWKINVILGELVKSGLEHHWSLFASVAAIYLYEHLEHRLPKALRAELTDARAMLLVCSFIDFRTKG